MFSPRSLLAGTSLTVAGAVAVAVAVAVAPASPAGAALSTTITTACGTPLSAAEVQQVVTLSDTTTITGATDLAKFDIAVARNQQLTAILARHKDYRGLFAVGLDAAERSSVVPLQHNPAAFADPRFGHALSPALLGRFLNAVHKQFLGQPNTPEWARYFDLAHQCSVSKVQIAMAGYNAHLNVDLAKSVAAVRGTKANEGDYTMIIGVVALASPVIIEQTLIVYGANIAPVWQVVIANAETIASVAFAAGLALQVPALAPVTELALQGLWRATDAALPVLVAIYGG